MANPSPRSSPCGPSTRSMWVVPILCRSVADSVLKPSPRVRISLFIPVSSQFRCNGDWYLPAEGREGESREKRKRNGLIGFITTRTLCFGFSSQPVCPHLRESQHRGSEYLTAGDGRDNRRRHSWQKLEWKNQQHVMTDSTMKQRTVLSLVNKEGKTGVSAVCFQRQLLLSFKFQVGIWILPYKSK